MHVYGTIFAWLAADLLFLFQLLLNPMVTNRVNKNDSKIIRYSTNLHLHNLKDSDAGIYQCVISNSFGPAYSRKAEIDVHGNLRSLDLCQILKLKFL